MADDKPKAPLTPEAFDKITTKGDAIKAASQLFGQATEAWQIIPMVSHNRKSLLTACRRFLILCGGAFGGLAILASLEKLEPMEYFQLRSKLVAMLADGFDAEDLSKQMSNTILPIKDPGDAVARIEGLITLAKEARAAADLLIPLRGQELALYQERNQTAFLMRHGSALGALVIAYKTGIIGQVGYEALRQQALSTIIPSVVGEVVSNARPRG